MKTGNNKLHEIIFEADTRAGKAFDVGLLIFILLSLFVVMIDSVEYYHAKYTSELFIAEWFFTILFTIEYILRILAVKKPFKYIFSFYGVIDLLSILPTFIGLFYAGGSFFKVFRSLRFLRLFKVFKLNRFTAESKNLTKALKDSQAKIIVFIVTVICMCMILGSVMYVVEGKEHGFTSIPMSIYWTIVTLTTVGYGDISPGTPLGQFIASVIMVMGYGIIAVPTGIVTAGVLNASTKKYSHTNTLSCSSCSKEGHADDAKHCKYCGEKI
jgi:voltage-gated potassium channel